MKKNNVDVSGGEKDRVLIEHFPFFKEFFSIQSDRVDEYQKPFQSLLSANIPQHILQFEMNRLKNEDVKYPYSGRQEMPVCLFDDVALVLKLLMPGQVESQQVTFLSSLPGDLMLGIACGGRLKIHCYKESPDKKADHFNPTQGLRKVETQTLKPGDWQIFRGGEDVLQFENQDNQPVVMFVLQSQDTANILWAYDKTTGQPWQSFSFKQRVSRMELAAEYLGSCLAPEAVEPLELLAKDKAHFVRWASVKNQLRRDRHTGALALKRAVDDPHPHIRVAAQRTLEKMQQAYGEDL